jgi:hypothetical protein
MGIPLITLYHYTKFNGHAVTISCRSSGKHTAVVIPINEWEAIISRHAELRSLEQDAREPGIRKYTMGAFAGTLSSKEADELLKYVEQSRNEWERDI